MRRFDLVALAARLVAEGRVVHTGEPGTRPLRKSLY